MCGLYRKILVGVPFVQHGRKKCVSIHLKSIVVPVLDLHAFPVVFQTDQCFSLREGLYVTGMSAEALQNLLDDFLSCGMYYYRLNLFSTPPVLDSFYKSGLTYCAFLGAIRSVLQYYRAVVLSVPTNKTLLQLKVLCHKLMKQLR